MSKQREAGVADPCGAQPATFNDSSAYLRFHGLRGPGGVCRVLGHGTVITVTLRNRLIRGEAPAQSLL